MKKIIISLGIIGVVAAAVIGGTIAYFSDTETSSGNTLTAGVIDIVVDDQNPWDKTYSETLKDMKPSQVRYIDFTIRNSVDSNPVVVWKHIKVTETRSGYVSEPECTDQDGTWDSSNKTCDFPTNGDKNDIYNHITYDMEVIWRRTYP